MSRLQMADAAPVRRGTARWAPHVRSCAAANARATAQTALVFNHTHGELPFLGHSGWEKRRLWGSIWPMQHPAVPQPRTPPQVLIGA